MTAYAMKGDRERCLEAGMDAYVSKPIRTEELLQTIEDLCAGNISNPANDPQAESVDEFDVENFIVRVDNDEELARELIELFFEDSPRLVSEIRNAIESGESEKLERAAHSLKGAVAYFS